MKTSILFSIIIFFIATASGFAQPITIINSDMPSVNDMYDVNLATPLPSIDPVPTGINHTWDFSALTSITQTTDTFKSLLGIGSIYALAFIGSSYGLRSTQDINLGPFTMEKVYNLFKNSSTKYEGSGQGAEISSIPTPMVFSPRDIIYKFPLDFGDADSASTSFSITIPTLGDYSKMRKRVNVVDGWGTLILPAGTFQVLRVKSTISDRDSISITGLPIPIVIPSTTIEYKWLGKLQGEPLLQINANQFLVTAVRYLQNPIVGINEAADSSIPLDIYPNPASGHFIVYTRSSSAIEKIEIYDSLGRKVYADAPEVKELQTRAVVNASDLAVGIYFLKVVSGKTSAYQKFVVAR